MKIRNQRTTLLFLVLLVLAISLTLGGCSDVRPIDSKPPTSPPAAGQSADLVKITYNYGDKGAVQLSDNNITLKVGQKLILQPVSGLTQKTRFLSSGEFFFNDVMEQEKTQPEEGKLIFVAKKSGKGKLQIIPNYTETDRAVDFWVTVK